MHLGRCSHFLRNQWIQHWFGVAYAEKAFCLGLCDAACCLPLDMWMQVRRINVYGPRNVWPPKVQHVCWYTTLDEKFASFSLPLSVQTLELKLSLEKKRSKKRSVAVTTHAPTKPSLPATWFSPGNNIREVSWTLPGLGFTSEHARGLPHLESLWLSSSEGFTAQKEDFKALKHLHVEEQPRSDWKCPLPDTLTHLCLPLLFPCVPKSPQQKTPISQEEQKFPDPWPTGLRNVDLQMLDEMASSFLHHRLDHLGCRYVMAPIPLGLKSLTTFCFYKEVDLSAVSKTLTTFTTREQRCTWHCSTYPVAENRKRKFPGEWRLTRMDSHKTILPKLPPETTHLELHQPIPMQAKVPARLTHLLVHRPNDKMPPMVLPPALRFLRMNIRSGVLDTLPHTLMELDLEGNDSSSPWDFNTLNLPVLEKLVLRQWQQPIYTLTNRKRLRRLEVVFALEEDHLPACQFPCSLNVLYWCGQRLHVSQFPPRLYKAMVLYASLVLDAPWPKTLRKLAFSLTYLKVEKPHVSSTLVDIYPTTDAARDDLPYDNADSKTKIIRKCALQLPDWNHPWWKLQSRHVQTLRLETWFSPVPPSAKELRKDLLDSQQGLLTPFVKSCLPRLQRVQCSSYSTKCKRMLYLCDG